MLYRISKRLLDILISTILWIVSSPLMLVISLAIKLTSRGPVFVIDCKRYTNFKPFFMYKFRSMKLNADKEILPQYPELQRVLSNDNHKIPINLDPRITKLGKFLRRTDLDELPQIINVLMGNMSLVGPRPYLKWEVEQILRDDDPIAKENIKIIQSVKPGITSLWFISGRNSIKFKQRLEIDAMYCRNRNFFLDLKILFKTPKILITGKGKV